jgi:hypothetical protein
LKKHNIPLIISAVLGVIYTVYIIVYFSGVLSGAGGAMDSAEALGGMIATALVAPHAILVVLAVIFNIVAVFTNKRGLALTAAILYSVAALMFMIYALFVVPSIVLCFVGFAQLGKERRHHEDRLGV